MATKVLGVLQEEAGKRGLELNLDKTKELAINSNLPVHYVDGSVVPVADVVKYLGTMLQSRGLLGPE
eukprot:9357-Alexandrium_andersonii.AAC.1